MSAYDALLDQISCRQQKSGRLDCEFRAGGVRFVIAGVGQDDAAVMFTRADTASEFVAGVVPLHGCVVVKPSRPADATRAAGIPLADSVTLFAFVSPRTGRVYQKWASCLSATRDRATVAGSSTSDSAAPPVARPTETRRADSATKAAPKPPPKRP